MLDVWKIGWRKFKAIIQTMKFTALNKSDLVARTVPAITLLSMIYSKGVLFLRKKQKAL
jgi:hypothetical protein